MNKQSFSVKYINLDRRPDRREQLEAQLGGLNPDYIARISAIDGWEEKNIDNRVMSSSHAACWLSHQVVYTEHIREGTDYVLVLEDDAKFRKALTPSVVEALIDVCERRGIDILQVGWIEMFYPRFSTRNVLDWVLASGARRLIRIISPLSKFVVLGEFRAGSHAYLISLNGSKKLIGSNIPAMFAVDGYLSALAQNHYQDSGLRFARLSRSLVGQQTRSSNASTLDSNIAEY